MRLIPLFLFIVTSLVVLSPGAAQANPFDDCKTSPTAAMPGQGWVGWMLPKPDKPPVSADPFAANSKTSIYEQYGVSGFKFNVYDQGDRLTGCIHGPNVLNNIANFIMMFALIQVSFIAGLASIAYNPIEWISHLNPLLQNGVDAANESIFTPLFVPIIILLGCIVAINALGWRFGKAMGAAGFALFVIVLVATVVADPVRISNAFYKIETEFVASLTKSVGNVENNHTADVAIPSMMVDSLIYPRWLSATLCDPTSKTAERYGPDLYKAGVLNWSEAAEYKKDPKGAGKQILERKADDYERIANEIQDSDPVAYECLKGDHSDDRIGDALIAFITVFVSAAFHFMAEIFIIGSYVIIFLAIILFVAIAVLTLLPQTRHMMKIPWILILAANLCAIVMTLGSLIVTRAQSVLTDPSTNLPGFVAVTIGAIFGAVMWVILKPFRNMTRIPKKFDPAKSIREAIESSKDHAKEFSSGAGSAAATAGGAVVTGPWAAAGSIAARRFAKKNTVTDEPVYEEDETPIAESFQRPAPEPVINVERDYPPPEPVVVDGPQVSPVPPKNQLEKAVVTTRRDEPSPADNLTARESFIDTEGHEVTPVWSDDSNIYEMKSAES